MTLSVRGLAFILLTLVVGTAAAQYQPQVGQAGKDVIWVPTPDEVVDRMLTMAQVTPQDFVMDLGAGDGKIAIAAAKKFGARAIGIEYNPDMAKHANATQPLIFWKVCSSVTSMRWLLASRVQLPITCAGTTQK